MKNRLNQFNLVVKVILFVGLYLNLNMVIYSQDDMNMEDATISLTFSEKNDVKTIIAEATNHEGFPIEDLELYFYVKRTFSLLPIGDFFNSTDENGIVEVEFPKDLPGDSEGHVTIVVKIVDSDLYNDLSVEDIKNWGVPVALDESREKRSLWAAGANAPITLVLTVTGLIFAIWFVNCYIVYVLYRISKIRPITNQNIKNKTIS